MRVDRENKDINNKLFNEIKGDLIVFCSFVFYFFISHFSNKYGVIQNTQNYDNNK